MLTEEELIPRAKQIAHSAHEGQTDQGGKPYIEHPCRVANNLALQGFSTKIVAAGWLHDVIEDSDITSEDLLREGFPASVVNAVEALSHYSNESLEDYIAKVRENPMAMPVKLADLDDNSDPHRLQKLPLETRERLIRKYKKSRKLLSQ